MPIPTHSPTTLNRMKKELLTQHVLELYEFIEIFSGNSIADLTNQIKDLKKQNNDLNNSIIWEWNEQVIALKLENQELKEEKKSWQEGEFKLTKELSEERTKIVELQKELERSQKLFAAQPLVKHIEELKEEIEKLKEDLKKSRSINTNHRKQKTELRKQIEQLKTDNKELMSAEEQLVFHCNYYKCYYDFLTAETNMKPDKDFIRDWCLEHGLGLELRKKLNASIL